MVLVEGERHTFGGQRKPRNRLTQIHPTDVQQRFSSNSAEEGLSFQQVDGSIGLSINKKSQILTPYTNIDSKWGGWKCPLALPWLRCPALVLQDVTSGEYRLPENSLDYFLQLLVNLQLSQNKELNWNKTASKHVKLFFQQVVLKQLDIHMQKRKETQSTPNTLHTD